MFLTCDVLSHFDFHCRERVHSAEKTTATTLYDKRALSEIEVEGVFAPALSPDDQRACVDRPGARHGRLSTPLTAFARTRPRPRWRRDRRSAAGSLNQDEPRSSGQECVGGFIAYQGKRKPLQIVEQDSSVSPL